MIDTVYFLTKIIQLYRTSQYTHIQRVTYPYKNMQQISILMQEYTFQIKADRALSDVSIKPRPTQQKSLAAQWRVLGPVS